MGTLLAYAAYPAACGIQRRALELEFALLGDLPQGELPPQMPPLQPSGNWVLDTGPPSSELVKTGGTTVCTPSFLLQAGVASPPLACSGPRQHCACQHDRAPRGAGGAD